MAEDDDRVHEDLQVAAMTAGAAAARVAETMIRAKQNERENTPPRSASEVEVQARRQASPHEFGGRQSDLPPEMSSTVRDEIVRSRAAADAMHARPAAEAAATGPAQPVSARAPRIMQQAPQRQNVGRSR